MKWTELAAGLGTQRVVAGLTALKPQVSKRQYKRIIATSVAQLLELHPDLGRRKARKRAQQVTGARPSKRVMRVPAKIGLKEGLETAAVAAGTGAAKAVKSVATRVKARVKRRLNPKENGQPATATDHQEA